MLCVSGSLSFVVCADMIWEKVTNVLKKFWKEMEEGVFQDKLASYLFYFTCDIF